MLPKYAPKLKTIISTNKKLHHILSVCQGPIHKEAKNAAIEERKKPSNKKDIPESDIAQNKNIHRHHISLNTQYGY